MSIKSSLKEINREGKKTKQFELQKCNKAETCSKGSKIEISKKEENVKRNLNPSLEQSKRFL